MAIPPPPYANIAGTSQIVAKYNEQESIANVDGNARPGQLIVDLTTDPPDLYIGNNAGNITLIASGADVSIGDWIFTGNDVTVNNAGYPHLYGGPAGGPELSYVEEAGNTASYSQTMYINSFGLTVSVDYGNSTMNFGTDGTLSVPGNITGADVVQANIFASTVTTYASLPAATTPGMRAFVNDSNLAASGNFGATLAGGAGNTVPVFSDGTNWLIG